MKRVIIESPYAAHRLADIAVNLKYLRAAMRDCLMRDEAPFASHGLYTQEGVLDDDDLAERLRGIAAGFAWRDASDMTVVYSDLGVSKGMECGIAYARGCGHPIEFRNLDGWGTEYDIKDTEDMEDYEKRDAPIIQKLLRGLGYELTIEDVREFWRDYSERNYSAGWLAVYSGEERLARQKQDLSNYIVGRRAAATVTLNTFPQPPAPVVIRSETE